MRNGFQELCKIVGMMVIFNFFLNTVISLVGLIPAVKSYNQRQSEKYQIAYKIKQEIREEKLKTQFKLEPLHSGIGRVIDAYSGITMPVINGYSEYNSGTFAFDSKEKCEMYKKIYSVMSKDDLNCIPPVN